MFNKKIWCVELVFMACTLGFEVAAIASSPWFSQGQEETYWEGGLLRPRDGKGVYDEENSYLDLWNKCDDGELDDLDLEGFCKSMRMYFAAGTLYIVLDVVSMCLCATAILLIILDLFNQDKLINLSIFFVWDTVFWHVMSYIAWACMVNLKFNGDCDELSTRDNLEMGNVCAGPGARLALFTIFYASAVAGTHTFIYYKFRVKKASPESESPENIKSMSITDPKHLENIQNN